MGHIAAWLWVWLGCVTTTWQWCSSRSSMLAAVVCSGKEPASGLKRSMGSDAERAPFVGGRDEPEQQLGAGGTATRS
jgi:hypothetical protein